MDPNRALARDLCNELLDVARRPVIDDHHLELAWIDLLPGQRLQTIAEQVWPVVCRDDD
jgi:hypothetical protein